MSGRREFTLQLTEAQFNALVDAAAYYETVIDDDPARYPGKRGTLERATDQLVLGWRNGKRR